jgi:hypothetical protein
MGESRLKYYFTLDSPPPARFKARIISFSFRNLYNSRA